MARASKNEVSGGPVRTGAVRDLSGGFGPGTGLRLQVRCETRTGKVYYVAGTDFGDTFSLWTDTGDGKLSCAGTGDSPTDLYGKIPWGN